jgi:uncharacterized cupin superfamily protein
MAVKHTSMASPDETKTFDGTLVQVVKLGEATVARNTFQPGWRWSKNVGPAAKSDFCQVHHVGYIVSGRLHVTTNDGHEDELGPGDAYEIQPGHDGWVVGDEPMTSVEFLGSVT